MSKNIIVFTLLLTFVITYTVIINIFNPNKLEVTEYIYKTDITEIEVEAVEAVPVLSVPIIKKQLTINYTKGVMITPKYIVIHETANTKAGANAKAHYLYWSTNPNAKASAHFVVDSNEIYQMLELNQMAWHVGDNKKGYSDITNFNSIGIEIAVNKDGDFNKARQNAIELTIKIMKELDMNIDQLKRHYDASGKKCPTNMLKNDELWIDFVSQVKEALNK